MINLLIVIMYKLGLTFGGFEYVHIGHINLICRASKMCDMLLVGLSSDEYIEEKKGHKPEFNWEFRKKMLEYLFGDWRTPRSEKIKLERKAYLYEDSNLSNSIY